jgi:hypothetical protein
VGGVVFAYPSPCKSGVPELHKPDLDRGGMKTVQTLTKDATIRERFNTYRCADYKEKVVDLLMRVTRTSMETVAVTEAMKLAKR